MKIIISGVPCCGKTHFGDWLRDNHRFTHANLEIRNANPLPVTPPDISGELPRWLSSLATNVVVTWGFPPNPACLGLIQRFRDAGFHAWWFDANHATARNKYVTREGIQRTEAFFDTQIQRINQAALDLDALYQHNTIETLTEHGYKPVEELARLCLLM
jgi:hypothetical protein